MEGPEIVRPVKLTDSNVGRTATILVGADRTSRLSAILGDATQIRL